MIGAGIYALIGDVVKDVGPHAPWCFALAALVMALNAHVLSIIAARMPRAGSVGAVVERSFASFVGPAAGRSVATLFECLRALEGGLALCITFKLSVGYAWALAARQPLFAPLAGGWPTAACYLLAHAAFLAGIIGSVAFDLQARLFSSSCFRFYFLQ